MKMHRTFPKREHRKKGHWFSPLKKGQTVKLIGERKSAKAVVMKQPTNKRGSVVLRVKETFTSVPKKAPFGIGSLSLKRKLLFDEWLGTIYGSARGHELQKEIRAIDRQLWAMEKEMTPKTATTTKTRKVPVEKIWLKESKPKRQIVPKLQRRKQRKQTLIEQARTKIRKGKNPKRVRRELAKKGVRVKRLN